MKIINVNQAFISIGLKVLGIVVAMQAVIATTPTLV